MTKFKVGDEVYYLSEITGNKRIGIVTHTSNHPKPNSVWAKWGGEKIDSWMPENKVFFVTPPKSTGFEVGKKYRNTSYSSQHFTVLFVGTNTSLVTDDKMNEWAISNKRFNKYEEYIPLPPEEWRIVYKDKYGNVTVGKTPFKSESEAKASRYWTDHTSSFKTIRVDA